VRCCVSQIFGGIFRCYAVVFSLFVGVLETECGFIIKFWKVRFLPPISRFGMSEIANWLPCCFRNDGFIKLEPNWSLTGRLWNAMWYMMSSNLINWGHLLVDCATVASFLVVWLSRYCVWCEHFCSFELPCWLIYKSVSNLILPVSDSMDVSDLYRQRTIWSILGQFPSHTYGVWTARYSLGIMGHLWSCGLWHMGAQCFTAFALFWCSFPIFHNGL